MSAPSPRHRQTLGDLVGGEVVPHEVEHLTPVKGSSASRRDNLRACTPIRLTTGTTYRWDGTSQYIFNWATKGVAPGFYYRVGVKLDDGQTYYVDVALR